MHGSRDMRQDGRLVDRVDVVECERRAVQRALITSEYFLQCQRVISEKSRRGGRRLTEHGDVFLCILEEAGGGSVHYLY